MVRKIIKGTVISLLIVIIAALCLYFYIAYKYKDGFSYGTYINGIYCTDSTVEEVNSQLLAMTDRYRGIDITDINGDVYSILAEDVNMNYDYSESLIQYKQNSSSLLWGLKYISSENNIELSPKVTYNTILLGEKIDELPIWEEDIPDYQRELSIKKGDNGYYLINDRENILQTDKAKELIQQAFENKEDNLDLVKEGCYENLPLSSEMYQALFTIKKLEEFQTTQITYKIGDDIIPIDASVACDFVKLDEYGNFVTDEYGNIQTDEEKIYAFIDELSDKYDTVGKDRVFRTTAGRVVNVSGGVYGNLIDREAEKEHLLDVFINKKNEVHVPKFKQFTGIYGTDDIGDTYVEVDMTNQHLYYYQNGVLMVDSDVVTGNLRLGHGTPTGTFFVNNKARNTVLTGADYVSHVKYWIAVYRNSIGIHDASWRYGKFGGEIYKTNGSHGCINTRTEEVGKLYDMIEIGTPVLVFY